MGGFPHSTGARQGGLIPTRHRRPVRWADSHTAPARGKVGRFPRGSGARQGGPIPTRQRRPARWADSHTAPAPGKVGGFPYRHVCSLCYPWIVQLSGSLVVWRSVPRNRPRAAGYAQYGAHCAPPWGTCGSCVAVSGIRALQLPCEVPWCR